ncbi:MAG: aspartate aminotransferase family protein, partial [Vulcanimicrobiaceae bacterium]
RAATGRPGIISFGLGFHGRTLLTLTMTGKVKPYKQRFGPYAGEIYHAPYPYEYAGWSTERAIADLHRIFATDVAPDQVAAIIIEPVLGEGGFIPAPAAYLRELRAIADRNGILLIADEIQSGMGRTGRMFAIEHSGVRPDMIVIAKSLAGGLPLSAVVGRADVMSVPEAGGLGGTFGGNPVACSAALAVLDIFEDEHVLERARTLGERLTGELEALARRHDAIGDVRGLGAMVGFELVVDRASRAPASEVARRLIVTARERGLLLLSAGNAGNVIRILVPLLVDEHELATGLDRLRDSCAVALSS